MRRLVLDLSEDRPIFAIPDWVAGRVRSALPSGWEVVVPDAPTTSAGDGGTVASPAALEAVRTAEVYLGFGVPAELVRAGSGLRWIHTGSAGVGAALTRDLLKRDILFTNSAGIHGPPVAETVIAYLLYFARGLDVALDAQRRRAWDRSSLDLADSPARELGRSTVGIVGLGGIGRNVARRAVALGSRVLGTRRTAAAVEGLEGVEVLTGPDSLARLLEASDHVVLSVPETSDTRGLIGEAEIRRMRRDAVLINVGRGGVIDEAALAAALREGGIRGAALDVFTEEPLSADHPLRDAPNLLITPHISSYTPHFWERETALILDNIARYLQGEPLLNVVDKRAGY